MEFHRLRRFLDPQARLTSGDPAPSQMRRHSGAMNAISFSKLVNRYPAAIVINEAIDLSGGEEGLKILNPPNHNVPTFLHRVTSGR